MQEKRILVTKAVGEHHRARFAAQLAGETYADLFIKTGTYVDVSHCLQETGPDNGPEDAAVDLQGASLCLCFAMLHMWCLAAP